MRNKELYTKLEKKLRNVFDDDDFVNGMLLYVDHEDDAKMLMQFIDNGEEINVESVTVTAIILDRTRRGEQ